MRIGRLEVVLHPRGGPGIEAGEENKNDAVFMAIYRAVRLIKQ